MLKRNMVTGYLWRYKDVSGVSGLGMVAEVCEYTGGECWLRWLSSQPSWIYYDCRKKMMNVHGHEGSTEFFWDNEDRKPDLSKMVNPNNVQINFGELA